MNKRQAKKARKKAIEHMITSKLDYYGRSKRGIFIGEPGAGKQKLLNSLFEESAIGRNLNICIHPNGESYEENIMRASRDRYTEELFPEENKIIRQNK